MKKFDKKPMKLVTVCSAALMMVSAGGSLMQNANAVFAAETANAKASDLSSLVAFAKTASVTNKKAKATKEHQNKYNSALKDVENVLALKDASADRVKSATDNLNKSLSDIDIDAKGQLRSAINAANTVLNGGKVKAGEIHDKIAQALDSANTVNNDSRANMDTIDSATDALNNAVKLVDSGASDNAGSSKSNSDKTDSDKSNSDKSSSDKANSGAKTDAPTTSSDLSGKNNTEVHDSKDAAKSGSKIADKAGADSKSESESDSSENADYDTLKANLDTAKSGSFQTKSIYAEGDEIQNLNKAVAAAEKLNKKSSSSAIDKANTDLIKAMNEVDKSAKRHLDKMLDEAQGVMLTSSFKDNDEDSKALLTNAVLQAQTVNGNINATWPEIAQAQAAVQEAMLEAGNYVDKNDLKNLINDVKTLQNSEAFAKLSKSSQDIIKNSLAKAEQTADDKTASKDAVANSTNLLRKSLINALPDSGKKAEKKALKKTSSKKANNDDAEKLAAMAMLANAVKNSDKDNDNSSNDDSGSGSESSDNNGSGHKSNSNNDGSDDNSDNSDNSEPGSTNDGDRGHEKRGALPQTGRFILKHAKAISAAIGAAMLGLAGYLLYDSKRKKNK